MSFIFCLYFINGFAINSEDNDDSSYYYSSEEELQNKIKQLTIEEVLNTRVPLKAEKLKGKELVNYINKRQTLWKVSLKKIIIFAKIFFYYNL